MSAALARQSLDALVAIADVSYALHESNYGRVTQCECHAVCVIAALTVVDGGSSAGRRWPHAFVRKPQ